MGCAPHLNHSTAIHALYILQHGILVLVVRTSSFVMKNHPSSPPHCNQSLSSPLSRSLMLSLPTVDSG
ncbi:hypothetical protein BLNAU_4880 [Blattamonas nauphoetae]|uniref:Uncharacterized protein n=1 Tax=Blattamonas nauphoetae TaxID=2049346 RepID=A0ABQ9Y8A3_9EUKA|nr:hypothetical protein BLNAU_4880 [Blattamonas nauphoetae]